jgi:hypothetical protein
MDKHNKICHADNQHGYQKKEAIIIRQQHGIEKENGWF